MTITLRSSRRHLRIALAVFAVSGGLVTLSAPSSALASTQIGQTFVPTEAWGPGTFLQSTSPAGQYSAPSTGVITSWSFRAGGLPAISIKLKVARAAGGDHFTIVGSSPLKPPVPGVLNTYTDVRIPVQAGDFLGLYLDTNNGHVSAPQGAVAGYGDHYELGVDAAPFSADLYDGPFSGLSGNQFDISATLEADCDGDGLGDETNPGTSPCNSSAGTTSAPTGKRAAAKKRCKKKFPKGPKRAKCLKKAKKLPV
jgi:hypothetical protein